jgi:hypothetical protein
LIKQETGLEVAIDQAEITDIVLGKRLSPTTFDFKMLQETWSAFDQRLRIEEQHLSEESATETAINRLIEEARTWLLSHGED